MESILQGCEVLTIFGWGVVIKAEGSSVIVGLDEWELSGNSVVKIYGGTSIIIRRSFCGVGNCVLTKYGSGILVDYDRSTGVHVVKLWQSAGKGSGTAYINFADISRIIPAITGLNARTSLGNGKIIGYRQSEDIYAIKLNYGVGYFKSNAVKSFQNIIFPTVEYILNHSRNTSSHWRGWEDLIS